MKTITLYSKDYCPYCVAAKKLLNERGIPFTEIDLSKQGPDAFADLQKRSGMRTVPQIFHGDSLIGGFDSLAKLDAEDGLASLKGKGP